jgi:cytochrome b6-f complex iron-sulfur subunit
VGRKRSKPPPAKPRSQVADRGPSGGAWPTTRRDVLRRFWRILGGIALVESAGLVGVFLWPRKPLAPEGGYGGTVTAGPADQFQPGTVTAFAKGQFYLVRLADGGFLALSRKCTHLGCTVPWNETEHRFVCPCHASAFEMTGVVLSPPAPRPLDRYAVRIEAGVVKVDTSTPLLRKHFESSEVVYA